MANRLFRVFNSKNQGAWYIARDEEDALVLAKDDRHIRILEGGTAEDQTEYYLQHPENNLETILDKRGRAWLIVQAQRMADIMNALKEGGNPPESKPAQWACADIDNKLPFSVNE